MVAMVTCCVDNTAIRVMVAVSLLQGDIVSGVKKRFI
jgi:hypothetical protein